MAFSRYGGYEIRVFDFYGREMFKEKTVVGLDVQHPNKELDLFQNFKGYADHFVLFKERKQLPLKIPSTGYSTTNKDSNALISLKFNKNEEVIGF